MADGPVRLTRRVLVVEAHEDTRNLYAEYLHASGFSVATCYRVEDAMNLAVDADAIVTALWIERRMDGFDFIARVRAAGTPAARIPIIVVTSHFQNSDRARAAAAGANIVFAKPCPPEMLVAALRQATQTDASSSSDEQAS
jgi:DNA-binding response OmpR family regulator